jgi:hypothetical protein
VSNYAIHKAVSNTKARQTDEDALAELVELLQRADLDSPAASLNETTISDNNGGRIEL